MRTHKVIGRRTLRAAGALVLALGAAAGLGGRSSRAGEGQAASRAALKNFQHVYVIMMENTGYNAIIGNPNAPWINAAAASYGFAGNYYGVTHPSQPNYVAATAGLTGPDSDDDMTIDVPNIVDQLESHGKSWKAYMQGLSKCDGDKLAHACGNQEYERKHNPFVSFVDVQTSPDRMAKIVDLADLAADLALGEGGPDYVWISPDQCNDMHGRGGPASDRCSFAHNGPIGNADLIADGDAFIHNTVDMIMASPAWDGNSVIFIAWDESDFTGSGPFGFGDTSGCCDANPGGGHVSAITISHSDHAPRSSSVAYNHYSMLATIQGGWELGCLGATCDADNVPPMSDLVGPRR